MKKFVSLFIITIGLLTFACTVSPTQKALTGKWQVTDMTTDMQGKVSDVLIENAKTIALAMCYEFHMDSSFQIEISKNKLENASRYIGQMKFIPQDQYLCLIPDSVFFLTDEGQWKFVSEKFLYAPQQMKIKKITSDKLILSAKDKSGTIDYTLRRIQ